MWVMGDSSFNATGSSLQRFARRQILDDLRRMHPAEMSLLEAEGFDMDWTMLQEVDTPLLEAMHAEGVPAQPMFGNDVVADVPGRVIVGDPEGIHILLEQSVFNKDAPVTLDGQHYAGVNTWREAIDEARQQLPRKRTAANQSPPLHPQVETTSERAVEETAEAEPEPERATITAPAVEAKAEAEAVDDAGEESASVSPAEGVAVADGVLIVPEELRGEPITSPLWRNGGLVEARKESGRRFGCPRRLQPSTDTSRHRHWPSPVPHRSRRPQTSRPPSRNHSRSCRVRSLRL